jgi:hypothetical protein
MPIRRVVIAAFAIAFVAGIAPAAAVTRTVDLNAQSVRYFSNRFIVTADGNVRARLSDGTVITGSTFSMDLKLNRFLIAGGVHVVGPGIDQRGAAWAGYPDLDESFFLPAFTDPDRWTIFGSDYAHPQKGRVQPGDAFFLPDVSGDRPFIRANAATIIPRQMVQFSPGSILALGVYVPIPGYDLVFSANPNFSQNGFAGAVADVGLPYHGSRTSVSAFHLRYDQLFGAYLAFDQHFVWDKDYIVLSADPLNRPQRQYNAIGFKKWSPHFETRLFEQESVYQHVISKPDVATVFSNLQATFGKNRTSLSVNVNQFNTSVIPFDSHHDFNPLSDQHPFEFQAGLLHSNTLIAGTPIQFSYRVGIGMAHNSYNVETFGAQQTPITTLWYNVAGFTLITPNIRLPGNINFNASFDRSRQHYSLPVYQDNASTTISANKSYSTKLNLSLAYNVSNTGLYYGARQLEFFPTNNIQADPGFAAFRGLITSRALIGGFVFTPNPDFALNLQARREWDTPTQVPFVYGRPPYSLTGDVRVRLSPHVLVDVSRSYFFNFANQRLSPQTTVQFAP